MKFFSENFTELRQLYVNQLRTLLSAEEQIVRALPTMVEQATDEQLRGAFQSHLQETEIHVTRLENILSAAKSIDPKIESTEPIKCKTLTALVQEAEELILDAKDLSVRDAALIAAAQRVEHYEIAAYGAVRHFAQILGEAAAAELLDKTAKEEGHADHLLSSIAERVNPDAQRAA
jgi:ferritin-like metal-binding protein YciE